MTTADTVEQHKDPHGEHGDHGHDDHGHHEHPDGPFIAHHFESAEQQFDSGKLGMWLFLVQEILFFSGLFVAYIIYRNHNPEVFEAAHVHLDKWLGGLNTIVLLFSSLTMAWAVRCSQLEQHLGAVINIVITMVCANIFLGVKAIEYTHKWELGLFWAANYTFGQEQGDHPPYLLWLSMPFIGLTLVSVALALYNKVIQSEFWYKFFLCVSISFVGYFIGLGIAWAMPAGDHGGHDAHGHAAHAKDHDSHDGDQKHDAKDDGKHAEPEKSHDGDSKKDGEEKKAAENEDSKEAGSGGETNGSETNGSEANGSETKEGEAEADESDELYLGNFFSIYYIMTGLHAIHILAGIAALTWLLYRVLSLHFRKNYFGPVENVGLYWHLVDLIWIFLFPMMYLIH